MASHKNRLPLTDSTFFKQAFFPTILEMPEAQHPEYEFQPLSNSSFLTSSQSSPSAPYERIIYIQYINSYILMIYSQHNQLFIHLLQEYFTEKKHKSIQNIYQLEEIFRPIYNNLPVNFVPNFVYIFPFYCQKRWTLNLNLMH